KRVPDTDQKIRAKQDGSGIEDTNLTYVLNPFDAIAVEEAIRIREKTDSQGEPCEAVEIIAVGVGVSDYESELRTALAMGADRAILIECTETLDPWNIAKLLAEVTKRESPDLILMGKQAVDDDSNQTGQFLAALLDWPQATFASKLEFTGRQLRVARETDYGIEQIQVGLPAVVTTDLRLNEPRYASLPSILKARKKEIETWASTELEVVLEPRIEILRMESFVNTRNCVMLDGVKDLVAQLVATDENNSDTPDGLE
nr:electron transfer flavoprotein subunit beta/FixA family protein [Pseudomonadales bacterium]